MSDLPRITATKMTFVLGVFCLAILGYAAIAYIYLSFGPIAPGSSIPYFVVRQRTALSALAMTTGISCVIMGFATFMIAAKGEVKVNAEGSGIKGALASGVPGPFFVLCGTLITLTVLISRVSYEEFLPTFKAASTSASDVQRHVDEHSVSDVDSGTTTAGLASRTIASKSTVLATQKIALYTKETAVYNALLRISAQGLDDNDINYLAMHEESLLVTVVDWDNKKEAPSTYDLLDFNEQNRKYNLSDGYLIVLEQNGAPQCVKALLQAAGTLSQYFPGPNRIPSKKVGEILQFALISHKTFSHGELAH